MQIDGTYTLQAPAEQVWRALMDQQNLQRAVPGLEQLTPVDGHRYTFALQVRYAPLRGAYTGVAIVLDPHYPDSYHLKIEGESPSNRFTSDCAIQLLSQNMNTVVKYQGSVELGRSGRLLSPPLVKGALKVLLHQFFASLADQLRSEYEEPVYVTTLEEMDDPIFMNEEISEQLLAVRPQAKQSTFLHKLVHLARLGQGNSVKEEQWERRLRMIGIVAVLLLLVWVGTRLPRRATHS
jgi:carbon monoxide dehydrogenase subunit G